jgi:hypothetical protein
MRFICCFWRPREEAALGRVERQETARLQRPSELATREGAPSPGPHANAKDCGKQLADAPRAGRCRYKGSSRVKNLDVRVEELKLRMVVILPKPPRRERTAHRRGKTWSFLLPCTVSTLQPHSPTFHHATQQFPGRFDIRVWRHTRGKGAFALRGLCLVHQFFPAFLYGLRRVQLKAPAVT